MALNEKQFTEKVQEAVVPIITNIASICLFENRFARYKFRDQLKKICTGLAGLQLKPNNSTHSRMKIIQMVYAMEFNEDFSDVKPWFAATAHYRENKSVNPYERELIPYADWETVYEDNREYVESNLKKLAYLIASQNEDGINEYIQWH